MSTEQNNNQQQNPEEQKAGCWKGFLGFIIFAIAIALIIFITGSILDCTQNNKDNNKEPGIFERAATIDDIDFDYSIEVLNLSVKIYIIPKVDINNLSLEINFYDADHNKLKTLIKTLGNVKEGERTEFTVSLTEFSVSQILTINYANCNIESGTVSIFS